MNKEIKERGQSAHFHVIAIFFRILREFDLEHYLYASFLFLHTILKPSRGESFMEGLTQLGSERLFSNDRTQQSFVATRSADYTTSRAKNVLGKSCDQDTGFSEIVAARPQTALVAWINLTESLIRQIHAQPVALLHEYLWRASKPVSSFFSQEPDLAAFLRPRRSTSAKR